ncbi:hypothetical protein PPSQR21_038340 [Paenibacillus polymyxa SQR-21]|nr:hypothetical protein PPSQR21_038340 [Paenibacillus polymyxa SQR-21]
MFNCPFPVVFPYLLALIILGSSASAILFTIVEWVLKHGRRNKQ